MAVGLSDLLGSMQQGVLAVNGLISQIKSTFPQVSALSTSATTGTVTFNSSQPATFLTIITSSGASMKIPLFNP